ncbi:prolyl 4-hydroxylase subunit alpha-2-like [Ptychodera flava]|uniref:prolyl 4-hydroxylase subunit alpha-2-like n=1 Tax=Ptychodera flava TaxID=63121 RepID=UPI00396A8869
MLLLKPQLGIFLLLSHAVIHHLTLGEEVFRSIARLRVLVSVERELIKALREYISVSRDLLKTGQAPSKYPLINGRTINIYERRLEEVTKLRDGAVGDSDVHVTHPVLAFKLLKRYMKLWNYLMVEVDKDIGKDIVAVMERHRNFLPNDTDFIGACRAIARLQSTYKISAKAMADGALPGEIHKDHGGLSVDDCFFIGQEAFNDNDDYFCVIWMEEGLRRYRQGYPIMPWEDVKETIMIEFQAYCYFRAGLYHKAVKYTSELLALDPENVHGLHNKATFGEALSKSNRTLEEEPRYPPTDEDERYHENCRGEFNPSNVVHPQELICRYVSDHPLIRLLRIGEEVLNVNPRIVMFRRLLDDNETNIMKKLALPYLSISRIVGAEKTFGVVIQDRVSNTAWLSDEDYPDTIIPKLTKRLELVTGLSADDAEPYQVLNYGIGGHYKPHLDADSYSTSRAVNERVATLLIYLSDVEYGGGTVFVKHGVRANPKKGDAAFWYNMNKSGQIDFSMEHGACPVLLGEKWIINKWFNYNGQISHRKCGLSSEE